MGMLAVLTASTGTNWAEIQKILPIKQQGNNNAIVLSTENV